MTTRRGGAEQWPVVVVVLVAHVAVAIFTWRDIAARPDVSIRGPRNMWRAASAINTVGSIAYWMWGRVDRRPRTVGGSSAAASDGP